ncbi:hypothetical protein FOA52_007872 [Chlamydomonas sp. UWO 241]|nr:hypothetical protein FOA52_007872 [Chlamydomonas sp. UWO 241]
MNAFLPWVVCVLFGVPFGLYRTHHVVMHHVEDNAAGRDLSSTEPYQRDSLPHFLVYWARHAIAAWVELPWYCVRTRRYKLAAATVGGMAGFWMVVAAMHRVNPVGAAWVLVIPFFFSSFLIMFGNWSQHVFVSPSGPRDAYCNSYNCLYCPDNCLTYNDGYHILHHLNSRLHWSQMPQQFVKTMREHAERDALSFSGIGFFDVGLAVFTGRLAWLADHVVPMGKLQAARSREEWEDVLRERLRPVTVATPARKTG